MSVETIAGKIGILNEQKLTTDVLVEVRVINGEITELEDLENGAGEGPVPGHNTLLKLD